MASKKAPAKGYEKSPMDKRMDKMMPMREGSKAEVARDRKMAGGKGKKGGK